MLNLIPEDVRASLIVFCITVSVAIFFSLVTYLYQDSMYEKVTMTSSSMRSAQNRLRNAKNNDEIFKIYNADFKELKERGIIGKEKRLSWLEVIEQVTSSRGIPSINYNIASQKKEDPKNISMEYSGVDLYSSVLSLDMKLMHEGDLFALLNALNDRADGVFLVDKCNIGVNNSDIVSGKIDVEKPENINAYCELSWYTIRKSEDS